MSKTVNIENNLYENLQKESNGPLRTHIEQILDKHIKRHELLLKFWSGLEIEKVNSDSIVLKNLNERKFYDVQVRDKNLYCEQDKSKSCQHTSFCWVQLEDLDISLSR